METVQHSPKFKIPVITISIVIVMAAVLWLESMARNKEKIQSLKPSKASRPAAEQVHSATMY